MVAYIVATVRIRDAERFRRYAAQVAGLSAEHGGDALLRGEVTEVLEGDGAVGERVVVTRFPTAAAARGYLASSAYQEIRQHRVGAADVVIRLVE